MARILLFSLSLTSLLTASIAGATIPVYVDVDGDASEEKLQDLKDSAEDLREQIRKRHGILLAEDAEVAKIRVTIMDRQIEFEQSRQTNYGGGLTQSQYQSVYVISYRLQVGDLRWERQHEGAGSLITWKRVATALAKELERWAQRNQDRLRP